MALINSQNRNSQRRGQMVNAYGAPIFDEAQLRALFQQIGTLDTTAGSEGGDQKKLAAENALRAKFATQSSDIASYQASVNRAFTSGIEYINSPTQFVIEGYGGGSYIQTDLNNQGIQLADRYFIELLKKTGFSAETTSAAAGAIAVLEKYTLWPSVSQRARSNSVSPYPLPKTTAVAKSIMKALYTLGAAITAADLYEGVYPLEPNPLAPDYTTKFAAYFSANYVP